LFRPYQLQDKRSETFLNAKTQPDSRTAIQKLALIMSFIYEIKPVPVSLFTIAALRRASMNRSSHSPTSMTSI